MKEKEMLSCYGEENEEEKQKEWKKFKEELCALQEELMEILREKKGPEAKTIFFKLMGDFAEKIREKYKDCEKYLAYHIIISSGTEFYYSPKPDFPEPFSVKSFLEGKIKEYEENKTD